MNRNNNQRYQVACIGLVRLNTNTFSCWWDHKKFNLSILIFFLLHIISMICLNIAPVLSRARIFSITASKNKKKKIIVWLHFMKNHFDHVDIAALLFCWRYPSLNVLNDYAIWLRAKRIASERGRIWHDKAKHRICPRQSAWVFISFLSNSLLSCLQNLLTSRRFLIQRRVCERINVFYEYSRTEKGYCRDKMLDLFGWLLFRSARILSFSGEERIVNNLRLKLNFWNFL